PLIAGVTKQRTNGARGVVVVHSERLHGTAAPTVRLGLSADCADATLCREHRVVLLWRQTVAPPSVLVSVVARVLLTPAPPVLPSALRMLAIPAGRALAGRLHLTRPDGPDGSRCGRPRWSAPPRPSGCWLP